MILSIFTDGGARGNPGPAAAGWLIKDENNHLVAQGKKYLGKATNNVAEYRAVFYAYRWLLSSKAAIEKIKKINFYLDSRLVVFQLRGEFKVKARHLMPIAVAIKNMEKKLSLPVAYFYIPREKNSAADRLVNEALDEATAL